MKNPSFQMRGAAVLVASPLLYRSSCVNSPLVLLLEVTTFEMIQPRQNDELTAESGKSLQHLLQLSGLDWTGAYFFVSVTLRHSHLWALAQNGFLFHL